MRDEVREQEEARRRLDVGRGPDRTDEIRYAQ
jgi:hypothetical protein